MGLRSCMVFDYSEHDKFVLELICNLDNVFFASV